MKAVTRNRTETRSSNKFRARINFVIGLSATIIAIIYAFIKFYQPNSHAIVISWAYLALIGFAYIMLLYIEDGGLFGFLFRLTTKLKPDSYAGYWQISITFKDENGYIKSRNGTCTFHQTPYGLVINGNKIFNEKNELEVDDWHSNSVEIFEDSEKIQILYTYFTYESSASLKHTKIGLVLLTETNLEEGFVGDFHDFYISEPTQKKMRSGTVKLIKMD